VFQIPNAVFWSIGAEAKGERKAGGGGEKRRVCVIIFIRKASL
jgi:hypothetical protein